MLEYWKAKDSGEAGSDNNIQRFFDMLKRHPSQDRSREQTNATSSAPFVKPFQPKQHQSEPAQAAHHLEKSEYSLKTAPRFLLPSVKRETQIQGLPEPAQLGQKLAQENLDRDQMMRILLLDRIDTHLRELQDLFDRYDLEGFALENEPLGDRVERIVAEVEEIQQIPLQLDNPEVNDSVTEQLATLEGKLQDILQTLEPHIRPGLKKAPIPIEATTPHIPTRELKKPTGAEPRGSLSAYSEGELIRGWKELQPDQARRVGFIQRQLEILEQSLEAIDRFDGEKALEELLDSLPSHNLALEAVNVGVRARLQAIQSGKTRPDDERWLLDHYLRYHQLLGALEKLVRELRLSRRQERDERRLKRQQL